MDILKFVVEKAIVLIPVLYVIGMFLKATPKVADWTIPWVLLGLGVLLAIGILGPNIDAVIQGILAAGTTVFTNQLIKQTKNRDEI